MGYRALYRQFRPVHFSEVVGQEHIVRTLQNALEAGTVGHAYLFSGPRGTGKTSVAKILARAVNCEKGPAREACGQCRPCRSIASGENLDVIEIDAASNRGIDEIRELREGIGYSPVESRYKVYIIDEVHMLTPEAFNALLKTLEEPPSHAIFVLATTEPQRIPPTIHSRCQRLDFHRLGPEQILRRMEMVCRDIGADVSEDALRIIALRADGAVRDALSLLDQCLSFTGGKLDSAAVLDVLGSAGEESLFRIAGAIIDGRGDVAIDEIGRLFEEGKDLHQLVRDLAAHFRSLLLVSLGMNDQIPGAIEPYRQQASKGGWSYFGYIMKELSRIEAEMKWSTQPRFLLEVGLLELAGLKSPKEPVAVSAGEGGESPAPPAEQPAAGKAEGKGVKEPVCGPQAEDSSEREQRLPLLQSRWEEVLAAVRKASITAHACLLDGQVDGFDGKILRLLFRYAFHRDTTLKNREMIEEIIEKVTGERVRLECHLKGAGEDEKAAAAEKADDLESKALEIFGGKIIERE